MISKLQVVTVRKRYEVGLEKLATTESSVADMQQELIALQPQLEVSTKETEAAMVVSFLTPCRVGGLEDTQDTAHMWHVRSAKHSLLVSCVR